MNITPISVGINESIIHYRADFYLTRAAIAVIQATRILAWSSLGIQFGSKFVKFRPRAKAITRYTWRTINVGEKIHPYKGMGGW